MMVGLLHRCKLADINRAARSRDTRLGRLLAEDAHKKSVSSFGATFKSKTVKVPPTDEKVPAVGDGVRGQLRQILTMVGVELRAAHPDKFSPSLKAMWRAPILINSYPCP